MKLEAFAITVFHILKYLFLPCTPQHLLFRYCLDGPVIFTDEVIWFCEDCETDVVVINDSDSESTDSDGETIDSDIETDSEKGEVDSSKGCATAVTIADPQPISDPIWR